MPKQILFIHGAGEETFELDRKLVDSLKRSLEGDYEVVYPHMPNADEPNHAEWKDQVLNELVRMQDEVILVGHSLGGSTLIKVLAEKQIETSIAGLFLIAAPFWNSADWGVKEYALQDDFADHLPYELPIYFYHSQDDEWVPVAHMTKYSEKLPNAITRTLDGRGHQFGDDLTEVAEDISKL